MRFGEASKQVLPFQGRLDQDLATVDIAFAPLNEIAASEAIDQTHHGVVAELQSLRERADSGPLLYRQAFQGQKELMLLRLDTELARLFFAEHEKAAQLVPELRERSIIRCRGKQRSVLPRARRRISIHIVARYSGSFLRVKQGSGGTSGRSGWTIPLRPGTPTVAEI